MSDSTRSHFALLMKLCKWLKCLCTVGAISYGYTRYRITERHSLPSQPSVFLYMLCLVPLNPLLLLHSKTNILLTGLLLTCFPRVLCCFSAQHNSLLLLCRLPSVLQRVPRPWCQSDRIQRIAPLLSKKLYRIIYRRVSMRYELGWGIPQLPMDSEFRQGCTGKWGLYMFSLVLQAG